MSLLDLAAKLTLDSSEYEKGLDNAESRASKVGSALKKGVGTVAKVGAAAVGAAAAGMVAFGKSSVDAGMTFDSSMSQVAATMGKTVDEIGDLRDFAQEMGRTTAFSASQSADALNYMALAGYDAQTSMEMLPNVLNLAAAGGMELATASDMVTDAASALGMTLEDGSVDIERVTTLVDQMAQASSKSNTSVAQLGEAILTVGGTARNLAGGTTELATVLGILADNGIKGAEGGTHLRNALLSLQTPTKDGTEALKQLDMTYEDMYDEAGNMRALPEIFQEISGAMEGMNQQQKDAIISGLFNKTDLAAINALLGTTSDRWDELEGAIDNASGAADKMQKTQLDNLAGDVTLFKSALEGAQIAVSDTLTPAIREFVSLGTAGISQITEAFQSGGFEGAASAAGEVLGGLVAKVIEYVPEIVQGAVSLVQSLANALMENAPMIMNAAFEVINILVSAFSDTSSIANIMSFGAELISTLANGIAENLPTIMTTAVEVMTQLVMAFTDPANISTLTTAAVNILTALGDGLTSSSDTIIAVVPQILENLMTALVENAPVLLGAGLSLITSLADSLMNALPVLIQAVPVLIEGLVNFIVNSAPLILTAGVQLIVQLAQGLITAIPSLISAVPLIISSLFQGIVQMLPIILNAGIQLMQQLTYGILQTIPSLISQIPMIIQSFVAGFTGNFGTILQTGVQLLVELGKGIIQGAALFVTQIPELVIQIAKSFIGGIPDMLNAGKELASGLWDGIKGMFSGKKDISVTDKVDFSGINEKSQSALDAFTDISTSATDTAGYVTTAFSDIGESLELPNIGTDSTFSALTTSADTTATGISTTFSTLGTDISTNISTGISTVDWSPISSGAQTAADEAVSAMSDMPDKVNENWEDIQKDYKEVPEWFQKTFDSAKQNVLSAWQVLPDEFKAVWEQIKNIYKEAPTWFQTTFNEARQNITTIFEGIVDDAYTWGSDMMENFNNGVNSQQNATEQAVQNQAQTVADNVGFSEPKEGPLSNFHTYAPDMMELFTKGIKEGTPAMRRAVQRSFDFRDAIKEPTVTMSATGRQTGGDKIDAVLAILKQYLPELANRDIVLDSGATVGALLPQIDSGLGASYNYKARGNA